MEQQTVGEETKITVIHPSCVGSLSLNTPRSRLTFHLKGFTGSTGLSRGKAGSTSTSLENPQLAGRTLPPPPRTDIKAERALHCWMVAVAETAQGDGWGRFSWTREFASALQCLSENNRWARCPFSTFRPDANAREALERSYLSHGVSGVARGWDVSSTCSPHTTFSGSGTPQELERFKKFIITLQTSC